MIHPSYVDLMKVVNKGVEEGEEPVISSRYSIVMATAKRARQLIDGDEPMVDEPKGRKPLSVAVDELEQGKLQILPKDEREEERIDNQRIAALRKNEFSVGGIDESDDEDVVASDESEDDDEESEEEDEEENSSDDDYDDKEDN